MNLVHCGHGANRYSEEKAKPEMNEAKAELAEALGDPAESARAHAVRALRRMGRRAKPATPSLISALEDPSPEVRAAAMAAVVNIRDPDDQEWVDSVVNALVLCLSDSDAEIRAGAAERYGMNRKGWPPGAGRPAKIDWSLRLEI